MTPANVQRGLRVDDILDREIGIQWTEAVALVGAACRQMVATGAPAFPAASQVLVYPEGEVVVLAVSDQHPVRGAAQLLTSLLADDVPVRLRLMLSQATGTEGAYTTLKEFAGALAYFERPDQTQVIREFYSRAAGAAVKTRVPTSGADPSQVRPPAVPRARRHVPLMPIAVVAVVLAAGTGAWLMVGRTGSGSSVFETGGALRDAVVGRNGDPSAPAKPDATEPHRTPRGSRASSISASNGHRPTRSTTRASSSRGGGLPAILPPKDSQQSVLPASEMFPSTIEVFAGDASDSPSGPGSATEPTDRIYTGRDQGVTPPRPVRPQIPSEPPAGTRWEDHAQIELIIAPDGRVQRVKMRTIPRDVNEFMILSAAKAWVFEPATFQGRPVAYRHRLWIALP